MTTENFELKKCQIVAGPLKTVGLHFKSSYRCAVAVFTHGYTSHKGDQLYWAQRLIKRGIETIIFDLPGHYLGSGEKIENFDDFASYAPKLFAEALNQMAPQTNETVILGGHSLGALLSLKALELDELAPFKKFTIPVSMGLNLDDAPHPLERTFFKETMELRYKLISPALGPQNFFPWLKSMKRNLYASGERIHFICGENDIVVPKNGAEELAEILRSKGNDVSLEKPRHLPHHEPAYAAPLIEKAILSHLKI